VIRKVGITVGSLIEGVSSSPGPVLPPQVIGAHKSQIRELESGWGGNPSEGVAADGSRIPFLPPEPSHTDLTISTSIPVLVPTTGSTHPGTDNDRRMDEAVASNDDRQAPLSGKALL
jgi:hypothetical protein